MKKFRQKVWWLTAIIAICMISTANAQTYELITAPPLAPNSSGSCTGGSGVAFNLRAFNTINVLEFSTRTSSGDVEIWYNTDSMAGQPTVTTANGWVLHETVSTSGANPESIVLKNPLEIPADETYGIFIYHVNNVAYYHANATQHIFADDNAMIHTAPNISAYAGCKPTPGFHPRHFAGSVTYELVSQRPPVASFSSPDTLYVNGNYLFLNNTPPGQAQHKWYIDGVYEGNTQNLEYKPTTTGSVDIKLVSSNKLGDDSLTKTIPVVNTWRKPGASFMAKNTLEVLEYVQLFDLSEYGPTSWEWVITPDEYFNEDFNQVLPSYIFSGSSEFSQNPELFFEAPGSYKVCLIATNSIGEDTLCLEDYITVIETHNMCWGSNRVANSERGVLYDDGGPIGSYSAGSDCSYLISSCAPSVEMNFTSFDLNTGDYLRVYDGKDNTGIPLWNRSAFPQGMTGKSNDASFISNIESKSGYIFLEFQSDASTATVGDGFRAEWFANPGPVKAPVANFDIPSFVCVSGSALFENTTDGEFLVNKWYLDGVDVANTNDFNYTFSSTGTHTLKLVTYNCTGIDSIEKQITVVDPATMPLPTFRADITRPSVNDVVKFENTTDFCVDKVEWSISPNSFEYFNNTDNVHPNPQVRFKADGCYKVTLKIFSGSSTSIDSVSCYINVTTYCTPAVVNLDKDIAINRVVVSNLNSFSNGGESYYTNYTSTRSANLNPGGRYPIEIGRTSNSSSVTYSVWIDYNQNGVFDASELVLRDSNNTTTSFSDTLRVPHNAPLGGTRMRVGVGHANNPSYACGPHYYGEFEDYRIFILKDEIAPELTLIGGDTIYVEEGDSYIELGANAWDETDGDISYKVQITGTVDSSILGPYTVTYTVEDAAGNISQIKRIVIVTEDATAPVITLAGNNPDTIAVHESWMEPGYTSMDNVDGDITSLVSVTGVVDTATIGIYEILYVSVDAAGNVDSLIRTVYVIDTISPLITLNGPNPYFIEGKTTYVDPGYIVSDNYDTSLNVEIFGIANTNVLDTYLVNYCVTDVSGNTFCITRTVIVGDTTAPTLSLNGPDTMIVEANSAFFDPGVNVSDNFYTNLTVVKTGTWPGHTDTIGDFTIVYSVTDGSGNSSTITRIVRVQDTEAPTITLLGNETETVRRWAAFNDPGVAVSDNYDQNPTIHVGGTYENTLLEGVYYITYQAEDRFGNKSEIITRFVEVTANTSVEENDLDGKISIYPNPNQGMFVVKIDGYGHKQLNMSVINAVGAEVGSLVHTNAGPGVYQVNLEHLKSGVYFIRFTTDSKQVLKKVIISK